MNKIKIMVDARVLFHYYFTNGRYGGIPYVCINILKKLKEQSDFDITLVYGLEYRWNKKLKKIKNDGLFRNLKFICINNFTECENYKIFAKCHFANLSLLSIIKMTYYIFRYLLFKFLEFYFDFLCSDKKEIQNHHIYFSMYNAIPDKIKNIHKIKFIILYDTIELFEKDIFIRERYKVIPDSIDKNTYIFFISQNTRNDFFSVYKNDFNFAKTFVCYIASASNFIPDYDRNKLNKVLKRSVGSNINNRYVLSLSSSSPRKNVPFTVECFLKFIQKNNIDDLYFFLAGASSRMIKNAVQPVLQKFPDLNDKIVILGYIQDEDMNIILSNALFFVFLSKYEGFGMPPLEAMQAGTAVITGNNSSLPEVVGDAAISVDCEDENVIIKAFEDLYFNEDLRLSFITRGLEQSKLFSWDNTISMMKSAFSYSLGLNIS